MHNQGTLMWNCAGVFYISVTVGSVQSPAGFQYLGIKHYIASQTRYIRLKMTFKIKDQNNICEMDDIILKTGLSLPPQGSVWINNRSRIVKSDYTTADGVIHHIDTLLTPYRLQDKPRPQPDMVCWV